MLRKVHRVLESLLGAEKTITCHALFRESGLLIHIYGETLTVVAVLEEDGEPMVFASESHDSRKSISFLEKVPDR